MEKQTLPNSTLVLIMGILSLIGCCCYGLPGLIFGIIAVVVGNKATSTYKLAPENYTGYENVKAGKIMGIIGIVLSLIAVLVVLWAISVIGWEALQDPELMRERMEDMQRQG
ncbi:MAG: DUF4190 domain-containing protein [Bacteroidia bacterium]|nr:DUF4190 domain-containing protein [Bacteroidia bacterium]NND52574.1 DUF4190 domain-containing protein [Flavobacteriaceae bacterium]